MSRNWVTPARPPGTGRPGAGTPVLHRRPAQPGHQREHLLRGDPVRLEVVLAAQVIVIHARHVRRRHIQAQRGSLRPGHEFSVTIQLAVPVCHAIKARTDRACASPMAAASAAGRRRFVLGDLSFLRTGWPAPVSTGRWAAWRLRRASAGRSSARATQLDHVAPLGQDDSASDESHCVSDQDDPAGPPGRGVRECRPGCDHDL